MVQKREGNNKMKGGRSNAKKMLSVGTRAQVWHSTARATSGGLTKKDLIQNPAGRIVSRKMSMMAKKQNRLGKAGFVPKKGVFKLFKKSDGKKKVTKKKATKARK
jgi:hypothetical protein